jgi:integrase
MVLFAAATGLRPGEWLAFEQRDIDREAQVVYIRRTLRNGRIKAPKTKAGVRAVPLQAIALAALDELPPALHSALCSRPCAAATSTCTTSATVTGSPPSARLGSSRSVASTICGTRSTFALRAGISTFDLSRYMGTSLAMIDLHYGHLARDGREHSIKLLDTYRGPGPFDVHAVDARWTPNGSHDVNVDNGKGG